MEKDKKDTRILCPECESTMTPQGRCFYCPLCGYSLCKT